MLSCVSAAAIIGCEKQIESEPPVLSSDAKDIHVTAEGGTQTITYNIENPAEDGMITALRLCVIQNATGLKSLIQKPPES